MKSESDSVSGVPTPASELSDVTLSDHDKSPRPAAELTEAEKANKTDMMEVD